MKIATSRITQQGQISVPLEVRKRLGLVPGAVIEWDAEGETIRVRRAGKYTSEEIHRAAFGDKKPKALSVEDMDAAIASHLVAKYARR
ncbi:MAG: AbrB/MazE/SpoVT family DNA-binding domain-containing protein [Actinomycetes bacterium]